MLFQPEGSEADASDQPDSGLLQCACPSSDQPASVLMVFQPEGSEEDELLPVHQSDFVQRHCEVVFEDEAEPD